MCLKIYLFLMNVAALFSGGKDSVFSIYVAQQYGWKVSHLVTISSENKESWMYHTININLTDSLAKSIGIPLMEERVQ